MEDKDLKNFKQNGGIRPSPLKVHNGLIANILQSSSPLNGTNSLHESAWVTYVDTISMILYQIKRFIGTNGRKKMASYRLKRFRGTNCFSERLSLCNSMLKLNDYDTRLG